MGLYEMTVADRKRLIEKTERHIMDLMREVRDHGEEKEKIAETNRLAQAQQEDRLRRVLLLLQGLTPSGRLSPHYKLVLQLSGSNTAIIPGILQL